MIALVLIEFVDVLRTIAASLSILFSVRKLYRLIRRKFADKKKPTD